MTQAGTYLVFIQLYSNTEILLNKSYFVSIQIKFVTEILISYYTSKPCKVSLTLSHSVYPFLWELIFVLGNQFFFSKDILHLNSTGEQRIYHLNLTVEFSLLALIASFHDLCGLRSGFKVMPSRSFLSEFYQS